jgi:hypothetical protein
MPVVDSDLIEISYGDPLALLHDLRAMGESNVLYDRQKSLWRRDVLMEAMRLYQSRHSNMDGRITARFQILFLTGWAPAPGQPRPKQPGSAKMRLADALGSREISIKNSRDP